MKRAILATALLGASLSIQAGSLNSFMDAESKLEFCRSTHYSVEDQIKSCQQALDEYKNLQGDVKYLSISYQDLFEIYVEQGEKVVANLIERKQREDAERLERQKEQREIQKEIDRLAKLPGVKIGMTTEEVLTKTSWGYPPFGKNKTITKYGTREQWVYGLRTYLYFENGKLTTIQQ